LLKPLAVKTANMEEPDLPIVKSIIEAMGSMVQVESNMGVGSQFYFNLELKLASRVRSWIKSLKKNVYDLKERKIFLVGKQILEKANLVVAYDGLIAVYKVRINKCDALFMDIQMPGVDGYTAAKEIRRFNSTVPLLVLSALVFQ